MEYTWSRIFAVGGVLLFHEEQMKSLGRKGYDLVQSGPVLCCLHPLTRYKWLNHEVVKSDMLILRCKSYHHAFRDIITRETCEPSHMTSHTPAVSVMTCIPKNCPDTPSSILTRYNET